MKFEIKTDNPFYAGWVAHLLGMPQDLREGEVFQEGWLTGHETANLIEDLPNRERLGRLYLAFLMEVEKTNIRIRRVRE